MKQRYMVKYHLFQKFKWNREFILLVKRLIICRWRQENRIINEKKHEIVRKEFMRGISLESKKQKRMKSCRFFVCHNVLSSGMRKS
jgi:hypothetical protein